MFDPSEFESSDESFDEFLFLESEREDSFPEDEEPNPYHGTGEPEDEDFPSEDEDDGWEDDDDDGWDDEDDYDDEEDEDGAWEDYCNDDG